MARSAAGPGRAPASRGRDAGRRAAAMSTSRGSRAPAGVVRRSRRSSRRRRGRAGARPRGLPVRRPKAGPPRPRPPPARTDPRGTHVGPRAVRAQHQRAHARHRVEHVPTLDDRPDDVGAAIASRSRPTATSAACGSAESPGSTRSRSSRETTSPGGDRERLQDGEARRGQGEHPVVEGRRTGADLQQTARRGHSGVATELHDHEAHECAHPPALGHRPPREPATCSGSAVTGPTAATSSLPDALSCECIVGPVESVQLGEPGGGTGGRGEQHGVVPAAREVLGASRAGGQGRVAVPSGRPPGPSRWPRPR